MARYFRPQIRAGRPVGAGQAGPDFRFCQTWRRRIFAALNDRETGKTAKMRCDLADFSQNLAAVLRYPVRHNPRILRNGQAGMCGDRWLVFFF
jgi:hypothetical protein